MMLVVEMTGTSVKTTKDEPQCFLELIRAMRLRSQVPVTWVTQPVLETRAGSARFSWQLSFP
jgi:hypothetical protein